MDAATRPGAAAPSYVRVATSRARDPVDAIEEASRGIDRSSTCFVLAFVSGAHDMGIVARTLRDQLNGIPVFGCSTAGQITDVGYDRDAVLLVIFPKQHFRCSSLLIAPLVPLSAAQIATDAQRQARNFRPTAGWSRLGLIFSDGLSRQEDLLASILETVLDDMMIFGGSAGDNLRFEETFVLHEGEAHQNAAVLLYLETDLPFASISIDHFLPSGSQIVITDADPEARKVFEINGAPAAQEYARLVGCAVDDLSPEIFAENPLLVNFSDTHYVRGISDADDTGALSFLAAIDDGLIMTLGKGQEILQTLNNGLTLHDPQGAPPDFILGFDCILRKLEIEQKSMADEVSEIFCRSRVFGFNTYGEQHCGVHMNQTFVGIAFFPPRTRTMT